MATGGDASLYKSGDGVYDFPCSACSEDNLNAEAEFCCNTCGKHYCNKCIDPHAKLFKRHDVLTRYFMDQWCKPTPNPVYDELEMCDTHHGKLLELICLDHDKPCCTICVSISHRSCKNIQQITATNPKSNDINIQQLVLSVQDAIENVKEKKSKEYVNKEKLDSYANEARCEIQKCVDELVASLNNLKVSSLDVLEKAVSEWVDRSIERSQSCFSHVTRLLNLKRLLESRVRNGETTTHTGYLACRSKVAKTKALLEELAYEPDPSVSFEPYRQIRHAVSGIQFLGQMTGTIMSKKEATSFTERVFKLEEKIAGNGKSIYVEKTKTTDYKQNQKYSMRITNDNACPAINGILQFENGHFVVIDTTNDRIKLLTNKFNVIDFLDMPKGITGFAILKQWRQL